MSSAICFNLDQSKILSSGHGSKKKKKTEDVFTQAVNSDGIKMCCFATLFTLFVESVAYLFIYEDCGM